MQPLVNKQAWKKINLSLVMNRNRNLLPLFVMTIGVFVIMSVAAPGMFLTPANFQSMAFSFPEFGLLAVAIMLSMLTGGIDLSIVGTANLSGVLAATIMTRLLPQTAGTSQVILVIVLALLAQLVTGMVCGVINGFLIAKIGIPEILATLGTMQLFTGLATVATSGKIIGGFPNEFMNIGNGVAWGIPISIVVFIVVALVVSGILNRTAFGYELYMMGTNRVAARFSGISNTVTIFKTYILSGVLSALAGILIISSNNAADPSYGSSYLLQAIVVCVLGGIDPAGGFGTVVGLVIAICCQQFLSSGFNILRIGGSASSYAEQMIWGAILLVVMVINFYSNTRGRRA